MDTTITGFFIKAALNYSDLRHYLVNHTHSPLKESIHAYAEFDGMVQARREETVDYWGNSLTHCFSINKTKLLSEAKAATEVSKALSKRARAKSRISFHNFVTDSLANGDSLLHRFIRNDKPVPQLSVIFNEVYVAFASPVAAALSISPLIVPGPFPALILAVTLHTAEHSRSQCGSFRTQALQMALKPTVMMAVL